MLDGLKPQYPDWEEVAFDATEYQASIALTKTENILNKFPDVNVIFSSYSGHTAGIIAAVKAAGKIGEIKIFDLGGDQQMFKALEAGEITSTQIFLPYEEQYRAVQSVIASLSGLEELDGVPATGHSGISVRIRSSAGFRASSIRIRSQSTKPSAFRSIEPA